MVHLTVVKENVNKKKNTLASCSLIKLRIPMKLVIWKKTQEEAKLDKKNGTKNNTLEALGSRWFYILEKTISISYFFLGKNKRCIMIQLIMQRESMIPTGQ